MEHSISRVPITERALLQRINRKLKPEGQIMKAVAHGSRWFNEYGSYFAVSLQSGSVIERRCDLEHWGRKVGALKSLRDFRESRFGRGGIGSGTAGSGGARQGLVGLGPVWYGEELSQRDAVSGQHFGAKAS